MFPNKPKVELTKIHYYFNEKDIEIPTISREIQQNTYNSNIVVKRNFFGETFVLKVNENQNDPKKEFIISTKIIIFVCLWVIICILISVLFAIYFSFDKKNLKHQIVPTQNSSFVPTLISTTPKIINITSKNETSNLIEICSNCSNEEICLKTLEFHFPICVKMIDKRDPSGCGGLCELNVQKCKKLHKKINVFQCVKNEYAFYCDKNEFNCGTSCIPKLKRCDGVIDCFNMIDEYDCACNLDYYFHCGNETSCIELAKHCDGVFDCWDGQDELDCPSRNCNDNNKYPCINGKECIGKEQYCDGVYDCDDHSDEPFGCKIKN